MAGGAEVLAAVETASGMLKKLEEHPYTRHLFLSGVIARHWKTLEDAKHVAVRKNEDLRGVGRAVELVMTESLHYYNIAEQDYASWQMQKAGKS